MWKKICTILGFRSKYEHDEYGIKYKTFYWFLFPKYDLFSYVVKE